MTYNTLSDEDYNKILEFSKNKELNIVRCGHRQYYYGLKYLFDSRPDIKSQCEEINSILKKYIPGFVSFSNFTGRDGNEIRFQGWYGNDHSFIGVCYLKLSELKG